MAIDPRLELVRRAYAALDEDDVAPFLELCASDATVDYPAAGRLPYGGLWEGVDAIARFLELHDETEEILDFDPDNGVMAGDAVLVRGFFRGRSKSTGRSWETRFVHVFHLEDGRIQQWVAHFDTAAAVDAHHPTGAA